jgi:hypothetical protein
MFHAAFRSPSQGWAARRGAVCVRRIRNIAPAFYLCKEFQKIVGRLRPTRLGASAVLPPDCDPGVDPAIHAAPARLRDDSGDAGYSQGPYTESSPSRVSSGSAPAELSSPWIGARRRPTRRARSERAWLAPSTRQCPNTIELLRPFSRKPSAFTRKFLVGRRSPVANSETTLCGLVLPLRSFSALKGVDGPDKPGHDASGRSPAATTCRNFCCQQLTLRA